MCIRYLLPDTRYQLPGARYDTSGTHTMYLDIGLYTFVNALKHNLDVAAPRRGADWQTTAQPFVGMVAMQLLLCLHICGALSV